MKIKNVIKRSNLPTNYPLFQSFTAWLVLDKLNAPEWIWGSVGLLFALVWIVQIKSGMIQYEIDIFPVMPENKIASENNKSKWMSRVEEAIKQKEQSKDTNQ